MKLSRRQFLKVTGFTLAASAASDLSWTSKLVNAEEKIPFESPNGMLVDTTMCIGCRACEAACLQQNHLPGQVGDQEELSSTKWTYLDSVKVENGDETLECYIRRQCFHCQDPSCASACPVGALHKTKEGPIVYDSGKCIGCRYCMVACPFQIPRYEWDKPLPLVTKCIMCIDRIRAGEQPACSEACPTGATKFGRRKELIAEAEERIRKAPDKYVNYVYGKNEVGGTSWLFLASVPFGRLGFPTDVGTRPLPQLTWNALSKVPGVVVGVGALLSLISYANHRGSKGAKGDKEIEVEKKANLVEK
ncbi:MAG: 4Fe-4S dicluster domain-containing protein [Syntrophothermus sp.]